MAPPAVGVRGSKRQAASSLPSEKRKNRFTPLAAIVDIYNNQFDSYLIRYKNY